MVKNLFKVEIKRHLAFLGGFILLELILSCLVLLDSNIFGNMQVVLSNMIWFLVPVYIFIDIYRDFHIGDNYLIHMIPMKTSILFLIKTLVFSLFLILLWSTNLIFEIFGEYGIYQTRIHVSSKPIEALMFYIIPRMVSIFSGIVILGLAISIGKLFRNLYVCSGVILIVIVSITKGILSLMKWNLINEGNVLTTISTVSTMVLKQYAGLITYFVVSEKQGVDIASSIHWNNVYINIIVGVIGFIALDKIFKAKRYELLGK